MPSHPSVLVVEDDWFLANEAAEAVRAVGLRVVGPFPNAHDALADNARSAPAAALLDVSVMDGTTFDLARRLRNAGVPVVFHSDWMQADLPTDLSDVALVSKWRGATEAVQVLVRHLREES